MNSKLRYIIAGGLIAFALGVIVFLQTSGNVVYFYTPAEFKAKKRELKNDTIKIGGMVLPGSVEKRAEKIELFFTLSDLKGSDITVFYKGAPPDLFKEGQGVVAEGFFDEGQAHFVASKLMVKHSEEYKKPGDHAGSVEKELLEKSIIKE